MQELSFKFLIDWASGKPIPDNNKFVCNPNNWEEPLINGDEKSILYNLREIRNDMAHLPYLTYDTNLKKEGVRKIIDDVAPIHRILVEKIIKFKQNEV